jgi:two-component system nitrogen regulation response regulator GlnG
MINVIYIDDESDTEKMSSKFDIMLDSGIVVVKVAKVQDALPTLDAHCDTVDLVVLDIIMPPEGFYSLADTNGGTTTGLRLLKDIRRAYPELPIIIVSVNRTETAEVMAEEYGVADYLDKPIEAFEIAAVIVKVVTDFRQRRPAK